MTGQSHKQAIAWVLIAVLAMTLAATMLALAAPDMAQAVSDTSQKVGDEAKGWLTVSFLVVAGSPRCRSSGAWMSVAGSRWPPRC